MKTYKVSDLHAGMQFSEPVYVDGESLLVPPMIGIKQKDIDRLEKWGIQEVQSEGTPVDPKEEGKEEKADSSRGESSKNKTNAIPNDAVLALFNGGLNRELLELYEESVKKLSSVFSDLKGGSPVEKSEVDDLVEKLVPAVKENEDEMISFVIASGYTENTDAVHAVNRAILSIVIGAKIKLPNHKIMNMAIGALLVDTGMMRIPDAIIQKKGALSEKEKSILQAHPVYSYKIITDRCKYPKEVGFVALQHHERWDGKGYPKKISGKNILETARIVSVADAFCAMVSMRSYRNSMVGYKAMRELLNDNSRRFDSKILTIFIKSIGIYPIGSIVMLNDGSIGRVIANHKDAPLRPVIRIIMDTLGKKYENDSGEKLDLLENKSLFISKTVNPREIDKD